MKKPQIPDPSDEPGQDDSTRGIIEDQKGIIEDGETVNEDGQIEETQ